jgi:cellulose synthase/poly-beta-1,6-N-acetylglucosamine synthase-like glycosyltransferase
LEHWEHSGSGLTDETMMIVITILILLVLLVYTGLMVHLGTAWYGAQEVIVRQPEKHIRVTVIIPARNETVNIPRCLESLLKQDYPCEYLEVLVSDDHSEDQTRVIAAGFIGRFRKSGCSCRVIEALPEDLPGKKAALQRAIDASTGELIITTDADCIFHPEWVSSIVAFQQRTNAHMVVPPVEIDPGSGWFAAFQAVEFAGLSGSGGASLLAGKPLMCNGANLAYLKSSFYHSGGFSSGNDHPSGDDTFLMFAMHRDQPGSVRFLKSRTAIVTAQPATSYRELISQRIRWISKIKSYHETGPLWMGMIVAGANGAILFLAAAVFFKMLPPVLLFMGFLLKCSGDLFLVGQVLYFLGRRKLLLLFLPAAMLLPVYFLLSGYFMLFRSTYRWKNRMYNG